MTPPDPAAPPLNRAVTLAARPEGAPRAEDFRLVESPAPRPGPGQLLSRTLWLSLDPYMRGRMNQSVGYAPTVDIGGVMVGGTVAQVVESRLDGYAPGDFILCANGWQEYGLSDGQGVRKLDPAAAPLSTALGVLGMPGLTAWVGLLDIGQPQPGETVAVSAAAGAVGAIVGQIARIRGCRVVGVAGAREKCDYVTRELGFDACVSRFDDDLPQALRAACPDGIDVYFENAGGAVFDAVVPLLNRFARVPVCGRIANYNQREAPPGPNLVPRLMGLTLVRRLTLRGFIVFDHADREPDFLRDMSAWLRSGDVRYREDVVEGLEQAVPAFQGLLQGKNFGKLLVRVSADPTRA